MLPETDTEAAIKVADRFRQLLLREQIPHGDSALSELVTVSMGIGTITPARGDSISEFLDQVDQRLYKAKRDGRDRMVVG